jgi:hypothetical protein
MIEWSWRIESARSILCGSWGDVKLWSKNFAKLKKAKVESVSLLGRLHEIDLHLSGRRHVVSFSTLEGYPHWTLFDKKAGSWVTIQDGVLCVERNRGRRK